MLQTVRGPEAVRVVFAMALLVAWIGAWAAIDDERTALMRQAMRGDAQARSTLEDDAREAYGWLLNAAKQGHPAASAYVKRIQAQVLGSAAKGGGASTPAPKPGAAAGAQTPGAKDERAAGATGTQ